MPIVKIEYYKNGELKSVYLKGWFVGGNISNYDKTITKKE